MSTTHNSAPTQEIYMRAETAEAYRLGRLAGLEAAAKFAESHILCTVPAMKPALPSREFAFGHSPENDAMAAAIRGLK